MGCLGKGAGLFADGIAISDGGVNRQVLMAISCQHSISCNLPEYHWPGFGYRGVVLMKCWAPKFVPNFNTLAFSRLSVKCHVCSAQCQVQRPGRQRYIHPVILKTTMLLFSIS